MASRKAPVPKLDIPESMKPGPNTAKYDPKDPHAGMKCKHGVRCDYDRISVPLSQIPAKLDPDPNAPTGPNFKHAKARISREMVILCPTHDAAWRDIHHLPRTSYVPV